MKILHFTESLNEGGIASFLAGLVPDQAKNHNVSICTIFPNSTVPSAIKESSVLVDSLNKSGGGIAIIKYPFKVWQYILINQPDVVNIHCSFIYYTFAVIFLHRMTKFFYTVHSDAYAEKNSSRLESLIWPIKKFCFKKGWAKPITISSQSEASFYNVYGFHSHTIFNGVPLLEAQTTKVLDAYRFSEYTLLFLHAGRISEAKNQLCMCRAFDKLVKEGYDVSLIIVGAIQDETIYSSISPYFGSRIVYLGSRDDVLSLFKASDAMLLPSKWEGLPITLLESMSQRCIPICSPVGGIPDVITHMQNGLLTNGSDEAAIYSSIKEFCMLSLQERERLKSSCYLSSLNYSVSVTAEKYISYYSQ